MVTIQDNTMINTIKRVLKKRITLQLLLLSFGMVSSTINAQEANVNPLVGTWLFDSNTSFAQRDQKIQDYFVDNPAMKTQVEAAYIGKQITFSGDGSYYQILANGTESLGTWQVQNTEMVITSPNGLNYSFQFQLSGNTLIISAPQGTSGSLVMVPNQYFTKL